METYEITVSDKATYIIRAASREAAEEQACEWFSERNPDISVTVTDEEPEYVIKDTAMSVNRVFIDTNIAMSCTDGEESYPKVEGQIDDESINLLSFPAEIERVSSSFFAGFFKELRKCYTPGELAELFRIDPDTHCRESAEKALLQYIHTA